MLHVGFSQFHGRFTSASGRFTIVSGPFKSVSRPFHDCCTTVCNHVIPASKLFYRIFQILSKTVSHPFFDHLTFVPRLTVASNVSRPFPGPFATIFIRPKPGPQARLRPFQYRLTGSKPFHDRFKSVLSTESRPFQSRFTTVSRPSDDHFTTFLRPS